MILVMVNVDPPLSLQTKCEEIEQNPRSSRQNELPVKRIHGSLLMGHESLASAAGELRQIRQTSSGPDHVLPHAPAAFDGVEVVPTMGREEVEAKGTTVVVEGRVELVRPMDAAAIDDHHDLCASGAEGGPHVREIVAQLLGITMRDDLREDFGGPILDGTKHTQHHAAGDAAPGAIRHPRLAFAGVLACDLALAQWTYREASALGCVPPARAGQGKAPQDGCVFREHNDLPTTSLGLEGGQCKSPIREGSGVGSQAPGGTIGAYRLFFKTPRTRSRPSWTPVSRAMTVASS